MIAALALVYRRCVESFPDPTSLLWAQLHHAQAFVHVGEYAWVICALVLSTHVTSIHLLKAFAHVGEYAWTTCALVLSTLVASSYETMGVLHLLHPLVEVDFFPFVDDFHLETKVILNWEAFIFVLTCSPCFFSNGPSSMVYELLWDCFVPNVSVSGLTSFSRYVGTLLKVMFHLQYLQCCVCFMIIDS